MKLIFVYNAKSGVAQALMDSVHKMVSPETYDCNLCAITFGLVAEDPLWKTFRKNSDHDMVFLHSDEFEKQFRSKWLPRYEFPIVLTEENNELLIFITSEEINAMKNSEELIELIMKKARMY